MLSDTFYQIRLIQIVNIVHESAVYSIDRFFMIKLKNNADHLQLLEYSSFLRDPAIAAVLLEELVCSSYAELCN